MATASCCPLCASAQATFLLRWGESEWFECENCRGCWIGKVPFDDPRDLYREAYYAPESGRLISDWWDFETGSRNQFQWILRESRRRVGHGRWLDVGCGGGFFLKLCRDAGYEIAGVELARQARQTANDLLSIDIAADPIEDCKFASESFDVISLNNVLEHLPAPIRTLREVHRVLRPGGLVTISVPNASFGKFVVKYLTPVARLLRQRSPIYSLAVFDATMHVYAFSPTALQSAIEQAQFRNVELFNEVPVLNFMRPLRNLTKRGQYRTAVILRSVLGPLRLTGHGITAFARKYSDRTS